MSENLDTNTVVEEPIAVVEESFLDKEVNQDLVTEYKELLKPEVQVETVKPELTEVEKEAEKQGWKPKTDFDETKNGKRWVSAEEYIDRRSFFKRIDDQKNEIHELRRTVREMGSKFKSVEEQSYQKALKELLIQRKEAVDAGDSSTFDNIEDKIYQVQQQINEVQSIQLPEAPVAPTVTISDVAKEFYDRNKFWFNNDSLENQRMINFAMATDELLTAKRPDLNEKSKLLLIEDELKHRFAHRFENENQSAPSPVASRIERTEGRAPNPSVDKLTDAQRALGKQMVTEGYYKSLDEYAKGLISFGVIK